MSGRNDEFHLVVSACDEKNKESNRTEFCKLFLKYDFFLNIKEIFSFRESDLINVTNTMQKHGGAELKLHKVTRLYEPIR